MRDIHGIVVDKDLKKYTYTISHYPDDGKCASCVPKATTKEITRAEFLELAYHDDVGISVVESTFAHPILGGATVQKLRKPNSFEVL